MKVSDSKPVHTVQVRELIEFVLRQGDLGGERQFIGSDRALAGIRGHQKIQRSRPAGYQTEIPVEHVVEVDEFTLQIRGRIDGLLVTPSEVLLEEIKTVQGIWDHRADPLHWAQARFYGFIYAQRHAVETLDLQLTYLELATGKVTELRQSFSFAGLSDFFTATTAIYVDWLRERHHWCLARDESIRALAFPFPAYRPGQRDLAVAAYRVLANGGRLFLAAPTGIGKTISVLFPAVKALGERKLERIFYLTARTVGRAIAEKACADLHRGGLKLRTVTITAKAKVCVRDGQPCDPLTCPMALGYYDRIKPAIRDALAREEINRPALEAVAQKHQVCPFELSLDVSVWADAIVCDYNYVFDPQVYLRRHFAEGGGKYAFLVDEAHNLVDRAREMFSADLDGQEILDAKRAIRQAVPRCARALVKLLSEMNQLGSPGTTSEEPIEISDPSVELNLFPVQATTVQVEKAGVPTSREVPERLIEFVEAALTEAETWLAQNKPAGFREQLLTLYFHLHSFRRTAELYDDHYATIIETIPSLKVRLFCLDPSTLLRQALARGAAAIFFSATLTPMDYYRTLLGGMPEDPVLQLSSPFPSENLAVFIQDRIQTHFKGRSESLGDVVEAIGTLVQGRRGNYLVYFPSYQYLNSVLQEFQTRYPSVAVLAQRPGMTDPERDAFLAAFSSEHSDTLVGFAVLGGIFGEGIDLVGERLIGAVIVGVGLPQLCVERDLIRDYFQQQNSAGFEYAYTFPGMNCVLQAIGRVIRSESDRGVALLIDARFNEQRYRRLFPAWWQFIRVRNPERLREAVAAFWDQGQR
ncbi:MAG TPA: ATP-dependent DNA helicase [Verrucomicrobiae bacterium]|nr:ATP-dependent DNA helicase [Verrucomicrobiae bacterium]